MPWKMTSDRPIFMQIMERIQLDIISGKYKPGEKLPSVRDLAGEAAVNPNTMQKALSELERDGLLHSERTSGRYITDNMEKIEELKKELGTEKVENFCKEMKELGYSREELLKIMEEHYE